MVEARGLGRPLVVSDLPVHREQGVPGTRYFDPRSADDLARVLRSAWGELPAGPDPAGEESAQADYVRLVRDSARTFLRLARGEPT